MSVAKGDKCLLLDNSQKLKWRVRSAAGQEGMVPAVCFRIPPPDDEARAAVTRLRTELAEFKRRWSDRQRTLRYNMIFATIKVVRSWDLQQVNVRRAVPTVQQNFFLEKSRIQPTRRRAICVCVRGHAVVLNMLCTSAYFCTKFV